LNDPAYLAWIGKDRLKDVIAKGVPRTAMPAFAESSGGSLTNQQVDILAEQMEVRWSHPRDPILAQLPPYSSELGDPKRGEEVFHKSCAACHEGKGTGGSIIDPSFLALVSDQSLRTTVVAGRTDRGMPNWSKLTPQDVSDVVAWVSSHREPSNIRSQSTND
jgi:mono/diheme cytochrome c family protein